MSLVRVVKSIFAWLWTGANALRKVLHLLVLLFMFGIFFGALSATAPTLPDNAALVIQPVGSIVEQLEGSAYDRAIAELLGDAQSQTLLQDILDGLSIAKEDDRINAVVLDLGAMGGAGLSKLRVIGDALDDFRSSGKPVIAFGHSYSQGAYYLASRASEVYLHEDGFMFLNGFGAYQSYYKTTIDKLLIDWNVFKVGTHKAAVEPFMRTDMSNENRESLGHLLGQLWSLYSSDIIEARGLDEGAIDDLTANFFEKVEAADGSLGKVFVDAGLLDELVTEDAFLEKVLTYVGEDDEQPGF